MFFYIFKDGLKLIKPIFEEFPLYMKHSPVKKLDPIFKACSEIQHLLATSGCSPITGLYNGGRLRLREVNSDQILSEYINKYRI